MKTKNTRLSALLALAATCLVMACDGPETGEPGSPGAGPCGGMRVDADQVILIGDSYPAAGAALGGIGGIQRQIEARAAAAGAIDPGSHYRAYYVGGTRFLNNSIQNQYTKAKSQNPDISVVIMTGGGNDVLQFVEGCNPFMDPNGAACRDVVRRSTAASKALLQQMERDGVEDVVFYFYPEVPFAPGHSAASEPAARATCDSFRGPLTCHFVSLLAPFQGHADYIGPDGIHPTAKGQQVIGDLVWKTMVDNCIAQ